MVFRTIVDIPDPGFSIGPCEEMLFVGSCFADSIGARFREEGFPVTVNPFGTMYNPASILHTIEKLFTVDSLSSCVPTVASGKAERTDDYSDGSEGLASKSSVNCKPSTVNYKPSTVNCKPSTVNYKTVFLTLGTNHVYRLKETGEIVDNCEKRPQSLFNEEELTVDACADYLQKAIAILRKKNPEVRIVLTVSPIRYRKYGYHGSQLSKATLLLAIEKLFTVYSLRFTDEYSDGSEGLASKSTVNCKPSTVNYFPAYEIVNDELRDYRFYASDMLHPSQQAVDYIWERLVETYFSRESKAFLEEWRPLKQALGHKPFNPNSEAYKSLMDKTMLKMQELREKYPTFAL